MVHAPRRSHGPVPMPSTVCPICQHLGPSLLPTLSREAHVDYFRCEECGHVWTVSKDGKKLVSHVTATKDSLR